MQKICSSVGSALEIFSSQEVVIFFFPVSQVDGEHMKEQLKQFSQQIQHKLCIPATNGDWVSLAQKPYIADNRFLEEMFSAKPGVVFVDQGLKALTKELGRGRLGRGRGQTMG